MEELIKEVYYVKIGEKTTVCCLKLTNGFEVIGTSACVDPKDFSKELGEKYAYEAAKNKLEELEGFYRQQKGYERTFKIDINVKTPIEQEEEIWNEFYNNIKKAGRE